MQPAVRIVKPLDTGDKPPIIAPVADREFWIEQRHALLMQLASIERKLGIVYQRCGHCDRRVRMQSG
jgi:hypothetical protein